MQPYQVQLSVSQYCVAPASLQSRGSVLGLQTPVGSLHSPTLTQVPELVSHMELCDPRSHGPHAKTGGVPLHAIWQSPHVQVLLRQLWVPDLSEISHARPLVVVGSHVSAGNEQSLAGVQASVLGSQK
jgi:hypothetical protein